jgi:hypothetical protein
MSRASAEAWSSAFFMYRCYLVVPGVEQEGMLWSPSHRELVEDVEVQVLMLLRALFEDAINLRCERTFKKLEIKFAVRVCVCCMRMPAHPLAA